MDKPWQKHYTETVPPTLHYPQIPIDGLLRNAAREFPLRYRAGFLRDAVSDADWEEMRARGRKGGR